jgi:hypothetical protein
MKLELGFKGLKQYKTVILPIVLYGYKYSFLTLKKYHLLRVFEKRALGKINWEGTDLISLDQN